MKRFNAEEISRMAEMYRSGKSLQETATALGRSLYGVYYRLQKLGVEIRTSGDARRGKRITDRRPRPPRSPETRRKMSAKAKARGASHNFFVDGKGKERNADRWREMKRVEYLLWREAVFRRDAFTCVLCGSCGGDLQADHILPWATHPDLRYSTHNGRTLCVPCHKSTPTYGGRTKKERVTPP